MSYNRRVIIVIPAADQTAANEAALQFDPTGGLETFRVGLSPGGDGPVTHFWASIQMREQVFQAVSSLVASHFPNAVMEEYELGTARPEALLDELGLQRVRGAED